MPVLLLARGDQESKNLLRHAIEARYGLGPPAIETLKIEMKGRARTRVGPIGTWMSLEGIAYFKFPLAVRWDYTIRPVGIAVNRRAEAFDGIACRKRENRDKVSVVDDVEHVASAQARLWAICALLLMPLAEHFVELKAAGERALDAVHSDTGITAHLELNEDHTLDYTSGQCLNPSSGKQQTYMLRLSEGQAIVDELMLPRKVGVFWDDQPEMELSPVAAESNPAVDDGFFRLEHD